jgi:hypothetical protein
MLILFGIIFKDIIRIIYSSHDKIYGSYYSSIN